MHEPFDPGELDLLREALRRLGQGFSTLPELARALDHDAARAVLSEAASRLHDNDPYHHPLYIGQMLKPPHPIARLAYALATWINPNNHALDGGRASSAMEKDAVGSIAEMFGWSRGSLGHLCSGGTVANLEALWIARELRPAGVVLASSQAHYTHGRMAALLRMPFRSVGVDDRARLDLDALARALDEEDDVAVIVVTLGATATGAVDPLPEILELAQRFGVRVHVDAAYGGYFRLVRNLAPAVHAAFEAATAADSIVIDPHKHGLQPYGCGCVLFRDATVGRFYRHDSPYTYFSSDDLHLGEISLECSRAGAAAVALWATQRLLPMAVDGAFARGLEACREAALQLHAALGEEANLVPLLAPDLDIVVFAVRAASASEASRRAREVFDAARAVDLHLALAELPRSLCAAAAPVTEWDRETLTCLRACAMKPEHREWVPEILTRLRAACASENHG